jgi:ParB/RepB/Spo0J family partition protein
MTAPVQTLEIDVEKLVPCPFNVRRDVGDVSELAESIKEKGVLQPIVVRPAAGRFEVIVGSRRVAAARQTGLGTIPAIVKQLADHDAVLESLTENIQRNNLEPRELGEAVMLLRQRFGLTEAEIGKMLSKSQDWVSGLIRSYDLIVKLEAAGKRITYRPESEERERGSSVPYMHTVMAQRAFDNPEVVEALRQLPSERAEQKQIELIETVAPLPKSEAEKVIDYFKMYPDKPVEEIKQKALAEETGVALQTYLRPSVARKIHEIAEARGQPFTQAVLELIETAATDAGAAEPALVATKEYERAELPQEPISAQIHSKLLWNLARIEEQHDLFTVGYGERSVEQLLEVLKARGVSTLVDVRFSPVSQFKPEFSKENLSAALVDGGIQYVHHPHLGVPTEIRREAARTADLAPLFSWYDENVIPTLGDGLTILDGLQGPVAFMCVELDPRKCHRHRIAQALEARGLKTYDL